MSVLNTPQPLPPNYAALIAAKIKTQTRQTFSTMTDAFNEGAVFFWQHQKATPAEIAAALGTDAREVFELHGKLGALLATVKPEAIAKGAEVVGQFEYNDDGTVTILSPGPPPPDGG